MVTNTEHTVRVPSSYLIFEMVVLKSNLKQAASIIMVTESSKS